MDLTEDQWKVISTILPKEPVRPDRRGRPWSDRPKVLNGVLWILRAGAPWQDLPDRYGAYQTAHRRFQNWLRSGAMDRVLLAIAQDLKDRGGLDLRECFIDGTMADGHGLPLPVCPASATPAEVKLVAQTVEERFVADVPERFFAWFYNFRRLVVRWEDHAEHYLGFLHLAWAAILLTYS